MLSLRGAPALSEFRAQKLSEKVSLVIGRSLQIYAEFMHFVQLDEELTEQQKSTLNQILRYGPAIPSHEPNGQLSWLCRVQAPSPLGHQKRQILRITAVWM